MQRVVIIGGGFGGLYAAKALRHAPVQLTLIDRRNFHLFQPLLYQVATGGLSPGEIASPLRFVLRRSKNTEVLLGEVADLDPAGRRVILRDGEVHYDTLIIATGASHHYFGHDAWEALAPGLKTIEDATEIRRRILLAFESAEREPDPEQRRAWLTFVIAGAGPTGVELAGSLAHMVAVTLRGNFRRINPAESTIILLEGGNRVLPSFAESLSRKATRRLEKLGVKVMTGVKVEKVDEQGVIAGDKRIPSATVLWTAGVAASPIVKMLGTKTDRAGRASVGPRLDVSDVPGVFVVGDTAAVMQDGRPVPGVAQAAIQQGRYVGRTISEQLKGRQPRRPFRYFDKGNMAVVGKNFAILEAGRFRMSGFLTWYIWAFIHVASLPQLQNRVRVETQWIWSYLTGQRSSRLIREAPRES